MADMNSVVRLAVDAYHGKTGKFSVDESMDTLRQALIAANNGSTVMNYKDIRDGKCAGLFTLIEEILLRTVSEDLQSTDFFMNLVEYRNVALGDKNIFDVRDNVMFVVSDVAEGTQGLRRQRISGITQTPIPTQLKAVKIYDEMNRVLSGQVDFNYFISVVAESFKRKLLNDVFNVWESATATDFGGTTYFPAAGTYNEETLLDLIAHCEAAAGGRTATILGTKKAVRPLIPAMTSVIGDGIKDDLYNNGYVGKFFGSNVIAVPQHHKPGTTDFTFNDKELTIIAGDEKPIKVVNEGMSTVILGNMIDNADLTQEYLYAERWGAGIVMAGGNAGIGRYVMT